MNLRRKPDTLYLHIGMHKTGTSALQEFFLLNEKLLDHKGVYYPHIGRSPQGNGAHHYLTMPVKPLRPAQYRGNSFERNIQILEQECVGKSTVLLSTETFCKIKDLSQLEPLYNFADRVKIILYLRRQDSWIVSAYSQVVKNRGFEIPIQQFINKEEKGRREGLNYEKLCDRWANFFGKENLIVRIYEEKQLYQQDIFADFLLLLGLPNSGEFEQPEKRVNPSLNLDALYFKKWISSFDIEPALSRSLGLILSDYSNAGCEEASGTLQSLLSPKEQAEIVEKYLASNIQVAKKYLGRKDGRLFSEHFQDTEASWSPYPGLSTGKVIEICDFVLEKDPAVMTSLSQALVKAGIHTSAWTNPTVMNSLGRSLAAYVKPTQ